MAPNVQYTEHHQPARAMRRRPQEDDDVNESWKKVVAKIGVYGAVGLYLGHLLVGEVRTKLTNIEQSLNTHVTGTAALSTGISQLVNLNLQQCINEARTAAARSACVQAQWTKPTE